MKKLDQIKQDQSVKQIKKNDLNVLKGGTTKGIEQPDWMLL
jgi:hypothetical protein